MVAALSMIAVGVHALGEDAWIKRNHGDASNHRYPIYTVWFDKFVPESNKYQHSWSATHIYEVDSSENTIAYPASVQGEWKVPETNEWTPYTTGSCPTESKAEGEYDGFCGISGNTTVYSWTSLPNSVTFRSTFYEPDENDNWLPTNTHSGDTTESRPAEDKVSILGTHCRLTDVPGGNTYEVEIYYRATGDSDEEDPSEIDLYRAEELAGPYTLISYANENMPTAPFVKQGQTAFGSGPYQTGGETMYYYISMYSYEEGVTTLLSSSSKVAVTCAEIPPTPSVTPTPSVSPEPSPSPESSPSPSASASPSPGTCWYDENGNYVCS